MQTIDVIMNNDTKQYIESTPKVNKDLRDKLYNFAMSNIKQKGHANFIFNDDTEKDTVIFRFNDITETHKTKTTKKKKE